MDETNPTERTLEGRLTILRWIVACLGVLVFAAAVATFFEIISIASQSAIILAALLSLVLLWAIFTCHRAKTRLENYRTAERDVVVALRSSSSEQICHLRRRVSDLASRERVVHRFYTECRSKIEQHLEKVMESEVFEARRQNVIARCADAKRTLSDRIEQQRLASPAIRAERTLTDAIQRLKQLKAAAEKQLGAQRDRLRLKWWFDLTRPRFEEVGRDIKKLEAALQSVIASGNITKTNKYYRDLASRVDRRTAKIEKVALTAIPTDQHESFNDKRIVHDALLLSAFSVPVSVWRDISQAGTVYDSLREVNGNYAGMSDADIWLDTLTMPGPELSGLANLTKGALFEKHVEAEFGGERFEHFNHPDTDILIDGVEYQIKATDSASYIDSVADNIPVISTSEIADITGSIDGGYANEDLTNVVDLALGGTVLDFSDTALDALLTGVGGVGIIHILKGAHRAHQKYKESGDPIESLFEGVKSTAIGAIRSTVNTAEIVTKVSGGVGRRLSRLFRGSGSRRQNEV
jgi:hypothetical protein